MTVKPETPLCGQCWEPTRDTAACERCGQAVDLRGQNGSYRLEQRLGEGASGVTFRARRLEDGQPVCVKALSFRGLTSFEAERLFQRETAILKQLRHPQIPNYIDSFSSGHGRTLALVLVQDLVDGVDLADEIAARRPTVDRVLDTLDELLSILEYLHALAPPVIHRDIKPKNIMRRRDGRLVLIDFGAVKDAVHASFDPGMSLVGTVGYMAPEQLRGEASAASDLYAVGMVAVFLLSNREPATLLDTDHTVRWERAVSVARPVLEWLRAMTHPRADERPASASEARRMLAESRRAPPRPEPARAESTPPRIEPPRPENAVVASSKPLAAGAPTSRTPSSELPTPRSSRVVLGVFGSALMGFFGLASFTGVGSGSVVFDILAGLLAALGWHELAQGSRRGARSASFAMGAFAAGGLLSLVSWRLGGFLITGGLVFHFAAVSMYLRGRSRLPGAPKWVVPSRLLQLVATVASVYQFAIFLTFDGYDPAIIFISSIVQTLANLANTLVFTEQLKPKV